MQGGFRRGWQMAPGFGSSNLPRLFGSPAEGLGRIEGPGMFVLIAPPENVEAEVVDDASAGASARRAQLAQALRERAAESYKGAGKSGAWNALPGLAQAISAIVWGER